MKKTRFLREAIMAYLDAASQRRRNLGDSRDSSLRIWAAAASPMQEDLS